MKKQYMAAELVFNELEVINFLSTSDNVLPDEENPL